MTLFSPFAGERYHSHEEWKNGLFRIAGAGNIQALRHTVQSQWRMPLDSTETRCIMARWVKKGSQERTWIQMADGVNIIFDLSNTAANIIIDHDNDSGGDLLAVLLETPHPEAAAWAARNRFILSRSSLHPWKLMLARRMSTIDLFAQQAWLCRDLDASKGMDGALVAAGALRGEPINTLRDLMSTFKRAGSEEIAQAAFDLVVVQHILQQHEIETGFTLANPTNESLAWLGRTCGKALALKNPSKLGPMDASEQEVIKAFVARVQAAEIAISTPSAAASPRLGMRL